MAKKKRATKTSKGLRPSSRKVHLSTLEKVLLGGGMVRTFAADHAKSLRNKG